MTTLFRRRHWLLLIMVVPLITTAFYSQQPPSRGMILARPRPVPIPDFTGKTLQQVQTEAIVPGTRQPLFVSINHQGPDNGVVATQDPKPPASVLPGSVRLFLTMAAPKASPLQAFLSQLASTPIKRERVPQLQGQTRDSASRLLEVAHLRASFTGDPGGTVVQQYPTAGEDVPLGSIVTVTLAVPEVVVPLLAGMTLDQARDTLQRSSLEIGKIEGGNIIGRVTSQDPPAGANEPPGTQVAVSINPPQQPPPESVPPVYVPNLEKLSRSDAEAALSKVGLRTGQVAGPATGFVIDQRPKALTEVEAQALVDFTLALPKVVVPDVLNDSEAVARKAVEDFGLHPRISHSRDWDAKAQHVVVGQEPLAGKSVEMGSNVLLITGNLTPPPPAWKKGLSRVWSALPLAPWWLWLAVAVPLGGVGLIWLLRPIPPPSAPPTEPPKHPNPRPIPECTLRPVGSDGKITRGDRADPKIQFTVGLRGHDGIVRWRTDREPVLTRKKGE